MNIVNIGFVNITITFTIIIIDITIAITIINNTGSANSITIID